MKTTIELYRDRKGKHRFRAKAGNGEILGTSEAYASKWNAKRAAKRCYPGAVLK